MEQIVDHLRRRRNALLIAAALAAGGYASYSYYRSESFQKRRRQLLLLMDSLSKLVDMVHSVADCAALISRDVKDFLQSEESEVPQSIRQVFKIFQCPEFQDVLVTSSSRACQEIMGNTARPRPKRSNLRGKISTSSVISSESSDGRTHDKFEEPRKFCISGSSSRTMSNRAAKPEGIPERLLSKLFSEAGTGFASAVVGSAVRNLVLSLFEDLQQNKSDEFTDPVPETYELGANGIVRAASSSSRLGGRGGGWQPENLLNLACTSKGKALISECLQLFVEAAVSTYLDKTRDVNVFEEVVEAVTKPIHQQPAREMILTCCNGAVDTFVRTCYEVLSSTEKIEPPPTLRAPDDEPGVLTLQQQRSDSNLIDKVLRALAVPSNRTLIMDLAGRITSEAVQSFWAMVVTSSKQVVRSNAVVVRKKMTREAVAKALIVMTLCLAVVLHLIANTGLMVSKAQTY